MNSTYTLFHAVSSILTTVDPTFSGVFGSLSSKQEGAYGIFFKGGVPIGNRTGDSGKYPLMSVLMTMNVNAVKSQKGYVDGLTFCESVLNKLSQTFNYLYTDPTSNDKVFIADFGILSTVNTLGFNEFDIPVFSLNFRVDYGGGSY